jgi:hypothetical protein
MGTHREQAEQRRPNRWHLCLPPAVRVRISLPPFAYRRTLGAFDVRRRGPVAFQAEFSAEFVLFYPGKTQGQLQKISRNQRFCALFARPGIPPHARLCSEGGGRAQAPLLVEVRDFPCP